VKTFSKILNWWQPTLPRMQHVRLAHHLFHYNFQFGKFVFYCFFRCEKTMKSVFFQAAFQNLVIRPNFTFNGVIVDFRVFIFCTFVLIIYATQIYLLNLQYIDPVKASIFICKTRSIYSFTAGISTCKCKSSRAFKSRRYRLYYEV